MMNQCPVRTDDAHRAITHPTRGDGPGPDASRQYALDRARRTVHPHCMACGNSMGVGLEFEALDDGSVEARFAGGDFYQGYSGFLHGGAIATLLDAAMTNCIFAHERIAVTAELVVQYHRPVAANSECTVRARVERNFGPLFVMQSELLQDSQLCVTATAKFMETVTPLRPKPPLPSREVIRLRG